MLVAETENKTNQKKKKSHKPMMRMTLLAVGTCTTLLLHNVSYMCELREMKGAQRSQRTKSTSTHSNRKPNEIR